MNIGSKKKRIMDMLVILLLILAILAGCAGGGNNGNGGSPQNSSDGGGSADGTTGEAGYPEKLTLWMQLDGNVAATLQSAGEIAAFRETERITGTKVEFQHPPAGQAAEAFNIMISSGDLPDAIEYNWASVPGGPEKAIADGIIIPLNDLIENHAPNLRKVLDEHPEWERLIMTDDGNIYVFPFIRGDDYLLTFNGIIIRQDWLDNLGLQMPETIDEWYEVLKAFKTRDPNGNGQQDEIPLLIEWGQININHAFIGAWGITTGFYQVDGKVHYGPIQPEFKEFLATMNRWYSEGLIDPDYATTDGTLKDAKVTGNVLGAFQGYTGSSIGKYMGLMKDDPNFNLVGAPNVVLNKGDTPLLGQKDHPFTGIGTAITTANKNPEGTAKWLDFKYGEEGHMLFNFGIEGESYEMIDGYPTYTDRIMNHPELPVTQAMGQYIQASYHGSFVQDRRYIEQYAALPQQKQAIETWMNAKNDRLMPLVTPTAEESSRYASIMNDVNTYYNEMINKFVMGVEPLDKFDQFVETLKDMGIEEAIRIQQAALDRFNSR